MIYDHIRAGCPLNNRCKQDGLFQMLNALKFVTTANTLEDAYSTFFSKI